MLYSLDRIEGELAVLIGDDGTSCTVPLQDLPSAAKEGKMYRKVEGVYVEDVDAELTRREQIRMLQNRLRCRKK